MPLDEQSILARMKSANVEQLVEVLARPTPEEERVLRGYFGEEAYRILVGLATQQKGRTRGVRGPLFDERVFLRRVEESNAEELAEILRQPSVDEERALRTHLGDDRFQRMHALALGRGTTRGATRTKGNVIVIPGIMGSEMTAVDRRGSGDPIWLDMLKIMAGRLDRFQLADDGLGSLDPQYDVRPSGILKRYYGELLLSLSRSWNVRAYWFDWRKDINLAADELATQISGWFGADASVHIVAHSMGGLVARTFIANYPDRWRRMWETQDDDGKWRPRAEADRRAGGRLVMLGTPNYGSYLIPQAITGLADTIQKLAVLDIWHDLPAILRIVNSFVGTYQMLPSPFAPGVNKSLIERLYQSATYYGALGVPQRHLGTALRLHKLLEKPGNVRRMVYIAGCNQPTAVGIKDIGKLGSLDGYTSSDTEGDGSVPHALGLLPELKPYFIDEEHSALPGNQKVLAALDELLETGETSQLSRDKPPKRTGWFRGEPQELIEKARQQEEARLRDLARQLRSRSAAPYASGYVSPQERQAGEILMRHSMPPVEGWDGHLRPPDVTSEPAHIKIGLVYKGIEATDELAADDLGGLPIDAISVGHYIGVTPTNAEKALDVALTRAYLGLAKDDPDPEDRKLVLTQYTERGTLRGELGQPFFLVDPRSSAGAGRVIAIAGMGLPGRFGTPELVVLVRELCWALGRQGKRHLAAVLIGSGNGALPIREAVSAWMRGVAQAKWGACEEAGGLERITFVEADPRRILDIRKAIREEQQNRLPGGHHLIIEDGGISRETPEVLMARAEEKQRLEWQEHWERQLKGIINPQERNPARITLSLDRQTYRFGAVTDTASIPEREIPLDPALIMRANDELAAQWELDKQYEHGRFLGKLLVPADLRAQLNTDVPLVMLLDSTTARIHWEMVAQADPSLPGSSGPGGRGTPQIERLFLSTARGFTRQLRTTFAPPPEPPPPPRRVLRVLVLADPAEDARLPGAEQEGIEVADLFEAFGRAVEERRLAEPKNPLYANGVEVVQLLGPRQATRTNVLRELALRPYDVLHYAGHCVYDAQHPSSSGWIFTGGERLSVNELRRIDNIPKFVFSNACESGITPDRADLRTPELAPSFAESFFERGVANFVCTAWPVDDAAARRFALTLYQNLLGFVPVEKAPSPGAEVEGEGRNLVGRPLRDGHVEADRPRPGFSAHRLDGMVMPMHRAMREARLAIASTYNGGRTWGAYQHYGSPNFRFFDHKEWPREVAPKRTDAGSGTAAATNGNLGVGASPIAGEPLDGVDVVANAGNATQGASTDGINPA